MPKKPYTKELSPKRRRFVSEYLIDRNATQAAIRSGYSKKAADVQGPRLLGYVRIKAAIEAGIKAQEERTQITADKVLQELARIGFVDMREAYDDDGQMKPVKKIPEDVARAIAGVDVDETFEYENGKRVWTGYTKKMRFYDKVRALIAIGNHLKMFPTQHEVTGKNGAPLVPPAPAIDWSKVTAEDLHKLANMKIEGSETDLSS